MPAPKKCMLVPADQASAPACSYAAPTEMPSAPAVHSDGSASNSESDGEPPGNTLDDSPNVGDQITAALVETCQRDLLQAQRDLAPLEPEARPPRKKSGLPQHRSAGARNKPLFVFFVNWKRHEHKLQSRHGTPPAFDANACFAEFCGLNGTQRYYWTHMHELARLHTRQQLALRSPASTEKNAALRSRELFAAFFNLDLAQQRLLVEDWLVERTARSKRRNAAELETCLARKTLAKIRADVLVLVRNIDYVLRRGVAPRSWHGPFEDAVVAA